MSDRDTDDAQPSPPPFDRTKAVIPDNATKPREDMPPVEEEKASVPAGHQTPSTDEDVRCAIETTGNDRKEPPAKVDPETLVLRAQPSPVVRFKREVIIGGAAASSLGLCALVWFALKPATFGLVAEGQGPDLRGAVPVDAVADAPATYDEVPQLGPPLPGDLGRPILAHQRELDTTGMPMATDDTAAQAAEAARMQAEAEERAARQSGIMMQIASTGAQGSSATAAAPTERSLDNSSPVTDPEASRSGPVAQLAPTSIVGGTTNSMTANTHQLVPLGSPYTLSAGSVIAASLITGLNSDLPGLVTAQVTQNVHDSATGRILLIPQGARLIGTYDSVTAFGQKRALVVWQRVILPGGASIRIDNMPASDVEGYAGLADKVDLHTWQLLKGVMLSTLLGVGSELSLGNSESDLVRALRESTQQSGARAGDQIVSRSLSIEPTLRVRPGWPLRIVVNKDLIFQTIDRSKR